VIRTGAVEIFFTLEKNLVDYDIPELHMRLFSLLTRNKFDVNGHSNYNKVLVMGKIQCFNTPNMVRKVTYQEYIQRGRTLAANEKYF
jgi:hypothetical protein